MLPAEIAAVRTMYKRVGLDPTKTRPSSEALLRRVRKGDALPRINSMVDVCNWCSLEFQLPVRPVRRGAHRRRRRAAARPRGRVLRRHPQGRRARRRTGSALADALGRSAIPTSDSARTMVTTATTRALLVVFAPLRGASVSRGRGARCHVEPDARIHRLPRDGSVTARDSSCTGLQPTAGMLRALRGDVRSTGRSDMALALRLQAGRRGPT